MRFWYRFIILLVGIVILFESAYLYFLSSGRPPVSENKVGSHDVKPSDRVSENPSSTTDRSKKEDTIHIGCVICGNRLEQASIMLKSILMFTKQQPVLHVVAEDALQQGLVNRLSEWQAVLGNHIHFKLYSLQFPDESWKTLFKPCASQRLFLPSVLKSVDSIIYLDIDTLFLRPVEELWEHFKSFSAKQVAAMAPEGEVPEIGWYPRFARHPFYGKNGLNSGVMLMNLTRMRGMKWAQKILPIYQKYKLQITWGDQDILNVLFHENPDLVYVYNCNWNYRPDHCMYGNNCEAAKQEGISIIHGNRDVFHNDKQPFFKAVFESMRDYNLGEHMAYFVDALSNKLKRLETTYCGAMGDAVLVFPQKYVKHT